MRRARSLLLVMVVVLGMCITAHATVSISYFSVANSTSNELGTALAANSLFITYWSAVQDTTGFNPSDPLNPTGGDIILTNATSGTSGGFNPGAIAGRIITSGQNFGTAGQYSGGYAYIALFETPYATWTSTHTITNDTWYDLGPISSLALAEVPPGGGLDYGSQITAATPLITDQQITLVPEPTTVGLVLVGMGVLAASRKRFRGEKKSRMR